MWKPPLQCNRCSKADIIFAWEHHVLSSLCLEIQAEIYRLSAEILFVRHTSQSPS